MTCSPPLCCSFTDNPILDRVVALVVTMTIMWFFVTHAKVHAE